MNPLKEARAHLELVRESYSVHGWFAIKWGFYLIWLGIASILHGIFPFMLKFHTPQGILRLKKLMDERHEEERMRLAQTPMSKN